MITYVTITSQGQICIPSKFRKILGLDKHSKATVELEGDKLVIRPAKDLMQLDGIISDKALPYSSEKTQKLEKKALEKEIKGKYSI